MQPYGHSPLSAVTLFIIALYAKTLGKLQFQSELFRKGGNATHRINHHPGDSLVCFVHTYPLDSDLSRG